MIPSGALPALLREPSRIRRMVLWSGLAGAVLTWNAALPVLGQVDAGAGSEKRKIRVVAPGTAAERETALRLLSIPEKSDGLIRLPLRVIVVRDLVMNKTGAAMSSWISPDDFSRVVLPELNRIWRPAMIEWVVESIVEEHISPQDVAAKQASIQTILNSQRDDSGSADPGRVPLIKSFYDANRQHPVAQNLHLFPYLGTTSQGVAALGGNVAYVGLWTDKPSRGTRPPERTLLVEPPPFKIGSLGRTCAHELGHNLKLAHPDKNASPVDRLMGGRKQGYDLTREEISTAREAALARARQIQKWAMQE